MREDHYIYFADGTTSKIIRKKTFTKDGQPRWGFLLKPSTRQKELYDLENDPDYDDDEDIVNRDFAEHDVSVREQNPERTRIWVLRTFTDEETDLTQREAHLTKQIEFLHKERASLQTTVAYQQQELHKYRTSIAEAIQDSVNLFQIMGEISKKKDSEEESEDSMKE